VQVPVPVSRGVWTRLTKPDATLLLMPRIELYEGSQKIADIGLPEKKFSTGSVGYWATQKLDLNGKRYQCQFQMVEIGSKEKKEATTTTTTTTS
jgi:hypothetical protein